MGLFNLLGQIVRSTGLYSKSLLFFLVLAGVGFWLYQGPLNAGDPISNKTGTGGESNYDSVLTLNSDGSLYSQNSKLKVEKIVSDKLYRLRYQVVDKPDQFIDSLSIAVILPKPITEDRLGSRLINNGGAATASSQLVDPQTVVDRKSVV